MNGGEHCRVPSSYPERPRRAGWMGANGFLPAFSGHILLDGTMGVGGRLLAWRTSHVHVTLWVTVKKVQK